MTIWNEKLSPQSSYMVPLLGLLFISTDAGATVRWQEVTSFTGPDGVVPPGSTSVLIVNAFTKTWRINLNVTGGEATYQLLIGDEALNYRIANGLPHGRNPSLIYGG